MNKRNSNKITSPDLRYAPAGDLCVSHKKMKNFKIPNRQIFEKKVKESFQFLGNEHDFDKPEVNIGDYRAEIGQLGAVVD